MIFSFPCVQKPPRTAKRGKTPTTGSKLHLAGQAPAPSRDPLSKVKLEDKTLAELTERARRRGVQEGIKIGQKGSAEKIKESAEKIKERDRQIKEQKSQIEQLTNQLALDATHLLLAGECRDLSALSISALTAHNNRLPEENDQLETQG